MRLLRTYSRVAKGPVRDRLEDSIFADGWLSRRNEDCEHTGNSNPEECPVFVIADGLGGHKAGDRASQIVASTFQNLKKCTHVQLQIKNLLEDIETNLRQEMYMHPECSGMGSTVAGIVLSGDKGFHFNVGDSRGYVWHAGTFNQITHDDASPHSRRLTQVLGGKVGLNRRPFDLHFGAFELEIPIRCLLCTDGITDLVTNKEIEQLMSSGTDYARSIVELALSRGGTDNMAVISIVDLDG